MAKGLLAVSACSKPKAAPVKVVAVVAVGQGAVSGRVRLPIIAQAVLCLYITVFGVWGAEG